MPKIELPAKLQRILTTPARLIVLVGGRGSAKSESVARLLLMKAQTERADVLCGREFQISIEDSVHKLIKELAGKLELAGIDITDKKIDFTTGGGFRFKGFARNSEAVKSAQSFKFSWVEEAQTLSQKSIDDLLPTIRAAGSKLFFTANPQSSADPFSKRFIVPYLDAINGPEGYYEDDLHLIIKINYRDNPWFPIELEHQRQWDYDNLPRAKYDHIWEGAFNDDIEDALIMAEWFDSCIDAHLKLGFAPTGAKYASHDPSDQGPDNKGFAFRHGSVILDVREMSIGDVNEGCDWACGLANKYGVDYFTWDCDGLGVSLNRQVSHAFKDKRIQVSMFRGSEGVDDPDMIYNPVDGQIDEQRTNKQVVKNKRAQYYLQLRDRVLRTHRAVTKGIYTDPDTMISFSSKIQGLTALRSELCRMPVKPNMNGLFELYTKDAMKTKFKLKSPNMGDSVMMLMRVQVAMAMEGWTPPRKRVA